MHGQTISDGALVPTTTYSTLSGSTNTIAQDLDDLVKQSAATKQSATTTVTAVKQSTFWWRILQGVLYFQPTTGTFAPFPVTNNDMLYPAKIFVTYNSDLYRNESIIIGGTDVQTVPETYFANGFLTAFPTGDNIDSIVSIIVSGQSQTFGIQGVDTGRQWYYQVGKQGITADPNATPLPNGTQVTIIYEGQIQVIAKARNEGQIALLASIDETSGVVTVVEQASGLNSAAAQALAVSRIAQYATFSITLQFTTCRPGLHIGQLLSITLPQHQLTDITALITACNYSEAITTINGVYTLVEYFAVTCTSGPIVGSWTGMYG